MSKRPSAWERRVVKARHNVRFPEYDEDIRSGKRTLFHMPGGEWAAGDMLLCSAPDGALTVATITEVAYVNLRNLGSDDADDLLLLNRDDSASYFESWEALHPKMPLRSNPLVCRIEFRYGPPELDDPSPEWSLAA